MRALTAKNGRPASLFIPPKRVPQLLLLPSPLAAVLELPDLFRRELFLTFRIPSASHHGTQRFDFTHDLRQVEGSDLSPNLRRLFVGHGTLGDVSTAQIPSHVDSPNRVSQRPVQLPGIDPPVLALEPPQQGPARKVSPGPMRGEGQVVLPVASQDQQHRGINPMRGRPCSSGQAGVAPLP